MVEMLTDPAILLPAFVIIAVLATFYTLAAPYFERGDLNKRMKAVALEREQMRARERARLNAEASQSKASLRAQHNTSVRQVVERLNLRDMLLQSDRFVPTLTEKMLTYALGRGLEPTDMPAVRAIVRDAAKNDYRLSSLIAGIVQSPPFRMRRAGT